MCRIYMENKKDCLLVGEGVTITGSISVQGAVHVYGSIKGEVSAESLYVGETGKLDGEVKVSLADIKGEVTNSIQVKETLIVRATGKISGSISYQSIEIEHGGMIDGKVDRNTTANVNYIKAIETDGS